MPKVKASKAKEKKAEEKLKLAPVEPKEEPRLTPEPKEEPKEGEPRLENKEAEVPAKDAPKEDYLRKYQYRKQTSFGSLASDPQPGSKAALMKEKLLGQEKVRIFVPKTPGEDPSIKLSVNLNGYRLDLPKQTYLEVPLQVAEVIMESLKQTEEAIQRFQISGNKERENALL